MPYHLAIAHHYSVILFNDELYYNRIIEKKQVFFHIFFNFYPILLRFKNIGERFATGRKYLDEAALSLRSRRNGTKFAIPNGTAH
mgnify:CR=1 FL=1